MNFIKLEDFSKKEITAILEDSKRLKAQTKSNEVEQTLKGKTVGLVFNTASPDEHKVLEEAVAALGGTAVDLTAQINASAATELSGKADIIVTRTASHDDLEAFAEACTVPVINLATDYAEPVRVIGDFLTISERKDYLLGQKLCYTGPKTGFANSLLVGCIKMGFITNFSCPPGYEPDADLVKWATRVGYFTCSPDMMLLSKEADVSYTSTWYSDDMDEAKIAKHKEDFAKYQVHKILEMLLLPDALVLNSPVVHVGEEISEDLFNKYAKHREVQKENFLYGVEAVLINAIA